MIRLQILLKPEQHQTLTEIARQHNCSLSDLVRQMLDAQISEQQQAALKRAAQVLLEDYQTDPELTAFHSLKGEDFY